MRIFHIGLSANGHIYNALQRAFSKVSDYREINTGHPNLNEECKKISDEFRPDLVFIQIQKGGIITEETAKHLRNNGAYVVNWSGDIRFPTPQWYFDLGKHIDNTLFSNRTDVEYLMDAGIKSDYLQIGIDEKIYCHEGEIIKMPEIVFFGNDYHNYFPLSNFRREMVEEMKLRYGNKFGVYGSGWREANGNFNDSQPEEAAHYRGAKIAINISHFKYKDYSSDRLFRILGTGVMCLAYDYPDAFVDGMELRKWNTLEELFTLCDYYLAHEEERKVIAFLGRVKCHHEFTFDSMINNLLKIYHENT